MSTVLSHGDPTQRTILGVSFFCGSASEAVARMRGGGLLVVPAAPALKDMDLNPGYRESLLGSDLAITDSALMVLVWNFVEHDTLFRLSGLEYLRKLLLEKDVRKCRNTIWVMASRQSATTNQRWLAGSGIEIEEEYIHIAPMYGRAVEDTVLVALIERLRPQHVIVTIGGGNQERLGLYLKQHLSYLPAIHCIGAAIAFLSGDQVRIPVWTDRFYLGWLLRCLSEPKRYIPRYWGARKLVAMILHYRSRLPPLRS